MWLFAYDVASLDELTAYERELLAPLGPLETVFVEGTGTGLARRDPAGRSLGLFVAGD